MFSIPAITVQPPADHAEDNQLSGAGSFNTAAPVVDSQPSSPPFVRRQRSFVAERLRAQLPASTLGVVTGSSPESGSGRTLRSSRSASGFRSLFHSGSSRAADFTPAPVTVPTVQVSDLRTAGQRPSIIRSISNFSLRDVFRRHQSRSSEPESATTLSQQEQEAVIFASGDDAQMQLRAVRNPAEIPIVQLKSPDEVLAAVDAMERTLEHWQTMDDSAHAMQTMNEVDQNDWKHPKRTYAARWQDRMSATHNALTNIRGADLHRHKAFAYYVDGVPVGIMLITLARKPEDYKHAPGVYLKDLATHPGSVACGGELIARAIAQSMQVGQDGIVRTVPDNPDAEYAYGKLGFRRAPGDSHFVLRPAQSNNWVPHERGWQQRQYIGEKHLA